MGTYLSTPVTEKGKESGEALECSVAPLVWGVVDMQGWRKSMEDSHVATCNVEVPPHLQTDQDHDAKVFGVFDGHGGAEVARFTQLYLVDVLQKQPTWIREPEIGDDDTPITTSPVGQALVDTFHALDRMIDQPERRDELIRLRAQKPTPGEYKTVSEDLPIPPEKIHYSPVDVVKIGNEPPMAAAVDEKRSEDVAQKEKEEDNTIEMNKISNEKRNHVNDAAGGTDGGGKEEKKPAASTDADESPVEDTKATVDEAETKATSTDGEPKQEEPPIVETKETEAKESTVASDATEKADGSAENGSAPTNAKAEASTSEDDAKPVDNTSEAQPSDSPSAGEKEEGKESDETEAQSEAVEEESKTATDEVPALKEDTAVDTKKVNGVSEAAKQVDGTAKEDDDSNAAVGKEDAAKLDQDLMLEDSDSEKEEPAEVTNRKVTVMFQKLLNLGGNSGQLAIGHTDQSDSDSEASSSSEVGIVPTIIQNGRQICNLPDHPIHAGCTAIVAVLIGRKLTVANAGDSRAVLCRAGGRAEALSFDHKPQQDRELTRINNAGGFVNQFGRVNGNLNLSRSIGDLKYKQVQGIHPRSQMITAEPDIVEVYLQSNDEFLILGCDGIWDCLTNNQAVKYVRERIDTMSPTEIGEKMLDEIISDDPRATQGIGGDNMTVMIIDLQPSQRTYRSSSPTSDE